MTIEFIDLRRKVGNQVIRAYLLNDILQRGLTRRVHVSLRGPKDEFKDFAKHFVLQGRHDEGEFRILVESGVYENLRIVGTDSQAISDMDGSEIIGLFTDALKNPDQYGCTILLSDDSKIGLD